MKSIDYELFKKSFLRTDIGQQILKEFDTVTCTNNNTPHHLQFEARYRATGRELLGNNFIRAQQSCTGISIVTLFYLELLQETNPKVIYDIGCGWNLWKRYYPNIIGIDSWSDYADIHDVYSQDFINKWEGKMDCAMSVNLDVDFPYPTNFDNVGEQIVQFSRLLKSGGRGYVSLPAIGFFHNTTREWYNDNNIAYYDCDAIEDYIKQKIILTDLDIIALDIEMDVILNTPGIDGEVRVVFRKS